MNIYSGPLAVIALLFSIFSTSLLAKESAPREVVSIQVTEIELPTVIESLGTLKSKDAIDLTVQVTEQVSNIHFDDGQRVVRGQLLLEMDNTEELAMRAEELSRLKEAERQVNRLEPLVGKGGTTQSALDEQRLQKETSQARLAAIEARLQQLKIEAPFSGVLGLRQVSIGAMLQPGSVVTTLDNDQTMRLKFAIPEVYLSQIEIDQKVTASTKIWPDEVFSGVITAIDSRVDPVTRSIVVRADFDNEDRRLKSGMLMHVRAEGRPRQARMVPESALLNRGQRHVVYLLKPENQSSQEGGQNSGEEAGRFKISEQMVTIGARNQGRVEILSGLESNQRVMVEGMIRTSPGDLVTLIKKDDLTIPRWQQPSQ